MGFEGDRVKKKITITSFEKDPLEITDITSTVDDKIKYKLKTVEKGRQYILEAENRSTEAGSYSGQMILKTTSRKKAHLTLLVNSNLRKEVAVLPKKLFFGTINKAEDLDRKLTRTATLRDVRGDGFSVKKIKSSSKWIVAEIEPQAEKKNYTLRISLDKDALPQGTINETVTLSTSYKGEPLVIEVKGEVL